MENEKCADCGAEITGLASEELCDECLEERDADEQWDSEEFDA
jgi:hypothetical protein